MNNGNRLTVWLAAGALSLATVAAVAQTTPATGQGAATAGAGMADPDVLFAMTMADGNLYEVTASQIAMTKATSTTLKGFAARMVIDHTAAQAQLQAASTGLAVTIPPITLDEATTAAATAAAGPALGTDATTTGTTDAAGATGTTDAAAGTAATGTTGTDTTGAAGATTGTTAGGTTGATGGTTGTTDTAAAGTTTGTTGGTTGSTDAAAGATGTAATGTTAGTAAGTTGTDAAAGTTGTDATGAPSATTVTPAAAPIPDSSTVDAMAIPAALAPNTMLKLVQLQRTPAGPSWDKTYALQQLQHHNATLTMLEWQARFGANDNLKAFAKAQIPIVKGHMNEALRTFGIQ